MEMADCISTVKQTAEFAEISTEEVDRAIGMICDSGVPDDGEPKKAHGGKRFSGHWVRTKEGLRFVIDRTWIEESS